MASQTPLFVLDENLPFPRGKGVDNIKADVPKPAKPARHERKALQDLSKAGRPLQMGAPKGSTLKDKAAERGHKTPKNASNNSVLTDEEIKKCHEWAKEGIEHAHFTGTEQRKLQREKDEEYARKKVDKVMSALRQWTDMAYNFGLPVVDAADVSEDIVKLEPEMLPPRARYHLNSDNDKLEDFLLEPELDWYADKTFELKLKDDVDGEVASGADLAQVVKNFFVEEVPPGMVAKILDFRTKYWFLSPIHILISKFAPVLVHLCKKA